MTSAPAENEGQPETVAALVGIADMSPALIFSCQKTGPARAAYAFPQASEARGSWRAIIDGLLDPTTRSRDFLFVHADDRMAVKAAVLRNLVEERDLDLTFRLVEDAGVTRWVRSQAKARREKDTTIFDCVCLDITAEMTRASRPEAMLADLSRDLRTPLQAILGFSELLAQATDPDRVADHARNIKIAVGSMLSVLERLPNTAISSAPDRLVVEIEDETVLAEPPSGARVLLADDLDLNRKLIADMLAVDGHIVDCVADGEAAVAAAAAGTYDLILMDMIMPVMDGLAATRAIRALPAPAGAVPIVALTANSFREQLDSCLDAGMDATLTKPMSIDALTQAVQTWTRARRSKAA